MKLAAKIGFITIGQTPREDIIPEVLLLLGSGIEIVERGALDGFSSDEILELRPEKDDFPLITRLRDGSSAIVGRRKIIPLIQKHIRDIEKQGASLSALLCTEDFPDIKSRSLLLRPSQILYNYVISLLSKGRLCVLTPLGEQRIEVRKKWERTGLKIFVEVLNPYQKPFRVEEVTSQINKKNVDLIVLDCIGYTLKIKEKVREATGKPVLLPRSVLARIIRELIG